MRLDDRMKLYENVFKQKLIRRTPIIIRIDGKAFHTFTGGMEEPWDERLFKCFVETAKGLCDNIQGARFAYLQSDEISILLTDYEKYNTEAWFDYKLQKLVSVSASMATALFNEEKNKRFSFSDEMGHAYFDSRAFNLAKEEVCNYFIWRQKDAERNSIQSLGRVYFSYGEMFGLSNNEVQNKLFTEEDVNWDDCEVWQKRGACVVKEYYEKGGVKRSRWVLDGRVPKFSSDRDYINRHVYINREE